MAESFLASASGRLLLRRIGVTLAALAIYRLGCWVPLPGVEARALTVAAPIVLGDAIERISIMALGLTPMLTALVVVEVAMIAWPRLRAWASAEPNADRFDGWIVWGTLVLAAVHANGFAVLLEDVAGLVPQPGLMFRAGVVVSLVTGTAVLIWLASLISRHGVGSGFWVLLGAGYLISALHPAYGQIMRGEPNGLLALALVLGFLVLCVLVLAALTKAAPPLAETGELLWAPILGFVVAGWMLNVTWIILMALAPAGYVILALALAVFALCVVVLAALTKAAPSLAGSGKLLWRRILGYAVAVWVLTGAWTVLWLMPGMAYSGLFDLALGADLLVFTPLVMLALFVILRRRSLAHARREDLRVASATPVLLALIGLVTIGNLLGTLIPPLWPSGILVLLIAAVGLAVVEGLARSGAAADATAEPTDPAP